MLAETLGESSVRIPAPNVLCVDNDPYVLVSMRRALSRAFCVDIASSAAQGLELLGRKSYAVVVSDISMPGMSGVEFLRRARELAPDTTRLLSSGHADFAEAVAATNAGPVFRFLAKPLQLDDLLSTVTEAVRYHHQTVADRGELHAVMVGLVPTLTELVCLLRPGLAEPARRTLEAARLLASTARLADSWRLEATGLMTMLACQSAPMDVEVCETAESDAATRLLELAMGLAGRLLGPLPRAREVYELLEQALAGQADSTSASALRLLVRWQWSSGVETGGSSAQPIGDAEYPGAWLEALQRFDERTCGVRESSLLVAELEVGMLMASDVIARGSGHVLLPKGNQLTRPVLERIRHYARGPGVVEPILVAERILADAVSVRRAVGSDVSGSDALGSEEPTTSGTWRTR